MFSYDIGIGAVTETEMAKGFLFTTTDNEMMRGPENPIPAFFDAPAGSRIVARVSNSGVNDAGNYNTVIHAVS
jgi:hypothetical protein